MFLAKDHAEFDTDRKKLAVWADIRHLQWGLAQWREYRKLQQHGRALQRKWLGYFTLKSSILGKIDSHFLNRRAKPPTALGTQNGALVSDPKVGRLHLQLTCPSRDPKIHSATLGKAFQVSKGENQSDESEGAQCAKASQDVSRLSESPLCLLTGNT